MKKTLIALSLALAAAVSSAAPTYTPRDLLRQLQSPLDSVERTKGLRYLDGLFDGIAVRGGLSTIDKPWFDICFPETVKLGALADAAADWMERNPTRLNQEAGIVVYLAWQDKWTCAPVRAPRLPSSLKQDVL